MGVIRHAILEVIQVPPGLSVGIRVPVAIHPEGVALQRDDLLGATIRKIEPVVHLVLEV